jgi:hypothetical protein
MAGVTAIYISRRAFTARAATVSKFAMTNAVEMPADPFQHPPSP